MTQFPLETLYSRRYTHSAALSAYGVFELLGMMPFAFSVVLIDTRRDK